MMKPIITPTRLLSASTTLSHGEGKKGAICRMISGITDGFHVSTVLVPARQTTCQQISHINSLVNVHVINPVLLRNLIE